MKPYILYLTLFLSVSIQSQNLNIIPSPKTIASTGQRTKPFVLNPSFSIKVQGNGYRSNRLKQATKHFLRHLDNITGLHFTQFSPYSKNQLSDTKPDLVIQVDAYSKLSIDMDESYRIQITQNQITLKSKTDIGALRGLETLLQLVHSDHQGFVIPAVSIDDTPQYKWRGIRLDAVSHFIPVESIKRNLDLMAMFKLNVLDWHLSDDQGWRIESLIYPRLQERASDGQYYTQSQIKDIVRYADLLGIRVYPSIYLPGHTSALVTGMSQLSSLHYQYRKDKDTKRPIAYTVERNYGQSDVVLDPTNPDTYTVLSQLFTEIASLFQDPVVHIGGDLESDYQWRHSDLIQHYIKQNKLKGSASLLRMFTERMASILQSKGKIMMGWAHAPHIFTDKRSITHATQSSSDIYRSIKQNHPSVVSYGFDLSQLQPPSYYYNAQTLHSMAHMATKKQTELIYGGEAHLSTQSVSHHNLDARLWPASAAIADVLWSGSLSSAFSPRMLNLEYQLELRGSQHQSNLELLMRTLARNTDFSALRHLSQYIKPVSSSTNQRTYFSLTDLADALSTNPLGAVQFKSLTQQYIKAGTHKRNLSQIARQWIDNHPRFQSLANHSLRLRPYVELSKQLLTVGRVLLRALNYDNAMNASELHGLQEQLLKCKKPIQGVAISIIDDVLALLLSKRPDTFVPENESITLDGKLNEWRNLTTFIPHDNPSNLGDKAQYALAHDGDDLFIAVDVTDSRLQQATTTIDGNPISDRIHLIVFNPDKETEFDVLFNSDGSVQVHRGDLDDIQFKIKRQNQTSKYTLEALLELDEIEHSRIVISVEDISTDGRQSIDSYTPNNTSVDLDQGIPLKID